MGEQLLRANDSMCAEGKAAAEAAFRHGAIVTVTDGDRAPFLLGELRWREGEGVFFFVAFGDDFRDALYLKVDAIAEERDGSIRFCSGGCECAKLEEIESADVEDSDDYKIAFQLWQQVAPLRQTVVERCFAAVFDDTVGLS